MEFVRLRSQGPALRDHAVYAQTHANSCQTSDPNSPSTDMEVPAGLTHHALFCWCAAAGSADAGLILPLHLKDVRGFERIWKPKVGWD